MTTSGLKTFVKTHTRLLCIGLITAAVIIGFQAIGQLVIYRYLKLDYYLSLVAVAFLAIGLLLKKPARSGPRQAHPLAVPELGDTPQPFAAIETRHSPPASPPKAVQADETMRGPANPEPSIIAESRPDPLALLTSKEFLVLRLLAEGKTNKEIAAAHYVEVSTVKTHINNIYAKLSVSNRALARARYAEIAARLPIS